MIVQFDQIIPFLKIHVINLTVQCLIDKVSDDTLLFKEKHRIKFTDLQLWNKKSQT